MSKKFLSLFAVIGAGLLSLGIVNIVNSHVHHGIDEKYIDENGSLTEPIDIATHTENQKPEGKYEENVALVKTISEIDIKEIGLDVQSIDGLYPNSPWKKITFAKTDAFAAVRHLRETNLFEKVDYNYIMETEEMDIESIDVSSNPNAGDLPYIEANGVGNAWGWGRYKHNHGEEEIDAGGSPDVVIAVIDTGVDYNHIDLRNNIWTNTAEIAGNGIDDDGNGYIDDVHGWDCVNEDNDPMDDNGHGTHVAGIAAAENNNIGTVGVAFNCKIMPIKAGNSSGVFTNSDIAEAITYAYMNGASVINMSFGGALISMSVEDALSNAYHQCVLVAAAGNNGICNQPNCIYCDLTVPFFPGSLPYVVGVMSCSADGSIISSFSNFDHSPNHYNQYEYDCYACGENIMSTWPNNKYVKLSGTSMASPVVAGIAALLRSAYPDRDTYSNKYIHSQLTNTGETETITRIGGGGYLIDKFHPLCNAYSALTEIPKPEINNLYNYYIFDNTELSSSNNGDGFIDAGETIRLGIELQNRGGKAKNVTAKIDTIRNKDENLTDPNVDIIQDTIQMDEIGTYSIQDGGKIYDGDKVVDMTNAFVIIISPNAQNGYLCEFNLTVFYENGLDDSDHTLYQGSTSFTLLFSRGIRLSGFITEDTVLEADKQYIISDSLTIQHGVTLTFEEGCKVVFFDAPSGYIGGVLNSPTINVYGSLVFMGTSENKIQLSVNDLWSDYCGFIKLEAEDASLELNYVDISTIVFSPYFNSHYNQITANYCHFSSQSSLTYGYYLEIKNGQLIAGYGYSSIDNMDSCYVDIRHCGGIHYKLKEVRNSVIVFGNDALYSTDGIVRVFDSIQSDTVFENNLVISSKQYDADHTPLIIFHSSYDGYHSVVKNNSFITNFVVTDLTDVTSINTGEVASSANTPTYVDNYFDKIYQDYGQTLITPNLSRDFECLVDTKDEGNHDDSKIWPYIKNISILNNEDEVVHTVGTEQNKVRVTFSREMDQTNNFELYYGSWYPYSDYKISGNYVSDTVWEGTLQVKANIEGGIQYFSSKNGCAKDDSFRELCDNAGAFTFNIDTSSAMSMNLQANPTDQGVELTWVQDDYDTLMGYNVYRSESKDGYYTKLNTSVIPAGEKTFLDDSCEPGVTYWYTFTVVLSDFSESAPAGKVSATPVDTISPTIYHTPVNQGYANNNLVISCTASDNIAVASATLYYRTIGDVEWKSLTMSKANDRYSVTIFGSEVTLAGIEYYISVTDGRNIVTRGSADNPYTVIVKDPSFLDNLGDVDGDGTITTKDALMIIRAINDELILTDDQFHRADLNKDGELSTFEALRILQYVNGNVTSLEM